MEMNNRRITKDQKFMMVQYMEEHSEFANERFVNDTGAQNIQEQWNDLATRLNGCGGAMKNGAGWRKAWMNIRCKAKQKSQDLRNALERSGINSNISHKELTELDQRILGLMTPIAIVGQMTVSEPLRSCGAVNSVELFEDSHELDAVINEDTDAETIATMTPRQCRPRKRKTTMEEMNEKMVQLEEKRLKITERKVEAAEKRNVIEERKAVALEKLVNVLEKLADN